MMELRKTWDGSLDETVTDVLHGDLWLDELIDMAARCLEGEELPVDRVKLADVLKWRAARLRRAMYREDPEAFDHEEPPEYKPQTQLCLGRP